MTVRGRPSRRGSSSLLGPLLALMIIGALLLSYDDALSESVDGDGGRGSTVLAAKATRQGDRARLDIAGRVRASRSDAPVAVRVLGHTRVAGPCPMPTVAAGTAIAGDDGSVRVGWRPVSGSRPGWALDRGRPFAMSGTVRLPSDDALRLCVHLVRGGPRPTVLRTTEIVVPNTLGLTPTWARVRPVVTDHVIPIARVVLMVLLAGIVLRLLALAVRRRGARGSAGGGSWPRMKPVGTRSSALSGIRRRLGRKRDRRGVQALLDRGRPADPGRLPPLPPNVRVPDAPPWPAGQDGGPGVGASPETDGAHDDVLSSRDGDALLGDDGHPLDDDATTDGGGQGAGSPPGGGVGTLAPPPTHDPDVAGRSAETTGRRREARWRARRRREAEKAGVPYDPSEPVPRHIDSWGRGAEGERLAAERFGLQGEACPAVHVLHDRRWPGRRRANIDHVLIGPAGVVVADTKHWSGDLRITDDRLRVGGWDQTKALDGVTAQVQAVRALLDAAGHAAISVVGVLHLTLSDGVLLDGSIVVRGIPLLDAPGTMRRASEPATLDEATVRRVLRCLEDGLPRAR